MALEFSQSHTFAFVTLGCKVNRVEIDTYQALIMKHGCLIVEPEKADFVLVNTCTVTAEADKKARKTIRSLLSRAPQANIIVTGCASAIHPEMFTSLDPRVMVVDRVQLIEDLRLLTDSLASLPLRVGEGFRTRVGIKIQDGCDNACTYCIVHIARGKARSVTKNAIVDEVEQYISKGVKEIVLTGIDLGAYRSENFNLTDLIHELVPISTRHQGTDEYATRFRLSSLEPLSMTDSLIELLALSDGTICRHLHLPLQSGSSKVLNEMNRPYNAEQFEDLVVKLYKAIPNLSLSTDIICGFPGESEDDFAQTLALAQSCRFSKIHVFPYSRREGTPAAVREDQVSQEVITERARELRMLAETLRRNDLQERSGSTELVLVEGSTGLTESYHEIDVDGSMPQGSLVPVILG